jgi:hypothetical protein
MSEFIEQYQEQVSMEAIKTLYAKDSVAKAAFDYFATRQRNGSLTKVYRLLAVLLDHGHKASYVQVRDFLRKLGELGFGAYVIGRRGQPSRLKWRVGMVSLGQAAAGQSAQVEQLTEEEVPSANDEIEEVPNSALSPDDMKLSYPLRRDRHVDLVLPKDITSSEAQRLSDFIKTLQFE